jgi:4-aminobutyrate aminotransferase
MAFHGRTLGALNLTFSKAVHKRGFPNWRRTRHVPFNGKVEDVESQIDPRPLPEILKSEGGVAKVVASGRIPRELVACFTTEAFQGEGGYRLADQAWLKGVADLLARNQIRPFLFEHLGVSPDILCLAKVAIVGMTLARAEFARHLPTGWHANTWGGGKIFDNHYAFATLDTYLHYKDPIFLGRTYVENQRIKGEYVRSNFAWLKEQHPEFVVDYSGLGGMWGVTVRKREELIALAWRRGLKLLGCGPSGDEARVRILFLADVLTREIDHFFEAFNRVLSELDGATG